MIGLDVKLSGVSSQACKDRRVLMTGWIWLAVTKVLIANQQILMKPKRDEAMLYITIVPYSTGWWMKKRFPKIQPSMMILDLGDAFIWFNQQPEDNALDL